MKKLLFVFLLTITSFVKADPMMVSNMILTNTVLITSMALMTDDHPKENSDFYINEHRIVENTSIDVRHIDKTLLKTKNIKEDFKGDSLTVQYSFNDKPYMILESTSLSSFDEATAYVSIQKVEYKEKKATVFIRILDKSHHVALLEQHKTAGIIFMVIGGVFFILLIMLGISLSI